MTVDCRTGLPARAQSIVIAESILSAISPCADSKVAKANRDVPEAGFYRALIRHDAIAMAIVAGIRQCCRVSRMFSGSSRSGRLAV